MSISSVSSSSSITYTPSYTSSEVTQLENQKQRLEKELEKVNQSNDDAKTKQTKTKQLQQQIQQIEARIQQLKAKNNGSQQATPAESSSKSDEVRKAETESKLINSITSSTIDVQV